MSVSSLKMEVPEAASARASGNNNDSNKCPAVLSRAGAVAMSAASLLFAWLAAGTLRRCGAMGEEEVFSGVLWGLSPLIWAYLYSWTAALSRGAGGGSGTAGFARTDTACLLLLANAMDRLIAPVAGAAAIVLPPLYSAYACGRALAKRRQRAGTERWSAATVASTPTYQSRAEEQEERERKAHSVSFLETVALTFSVNVGCISWMLPETKWEAPSTEAVFYLAGPLILAVQLMLMPPCMFGSPVLAMDDVRAVAAVVGAVGWLVVGTSVVGSLFGTIAGTVVVWMGELGMVGFLGYFLAVEAHYEQLMVIERYNPIYFDCDERITRLLFLQEISLHQIKLQYSVIYRWIDHQ